MFCRRELLHRSNKAYEQWINYLFQILYDMNNKSKIIQQRQLHEYNNITFDCVLMVLIKAKGK